METLRRVLRPALSLTGWRGRALDLILGSLAVLSLAPFHIYGIAIVALAVLAWRLYTVPKTQPRPSRSAFGIGFWFGLGYFLFGMFWIGSAFIERGPEFIWIMPPMILGLAALLAFFWGLAGYIYNRVGPSAAFAPFIFMATFTLAEITRGHILTGLPWNLTGYIFEAGGQISQIASVVGIYGLTMMTFLLAGFLGRPTKPSLKSAACVMVAVSLVFGFGHYRLTTAENGTVPNVKLRIVQFPFKQSDQFDADASFKIANEYLNLSRAPGLEDITHVIWPEGAVTGLVLENQGLISAMSKSMLSADSSPPVWLLNTLREESRTLSDGRMVLDYFNSSAAITFGADGSAALAAINDKAHLVPFGEYVPGGKWLEDRGIMPLSTALASISPAPHKLLSDFPGLPRLSPQICYEIIFPNMTPKDKINPPQWILNQSNDAWYGKSTGPYQHANQARYRAIEEGLPVVRAAANGVSGIVNSYGNWVKSAKIDEKTVIDASLPVRTAKSMYSFNLIVFLALLNFGLCLLSIQRQIHAKL